MSHHHELTNGPIDLQFGTHIGKTRECHGLFKIQNSFLLLKKILKNVFFCQFLASNFFAIDFKVPKISKSVERNVLNPTKYCLLIFTK